VPKQRHVHRRCFAFTAPTDRERSTGRSEAIGPKHDTRRLLEGDDLTRLGHVLLHSAAQVLSDTGEVTRLTPLWLARHLGPVPPRPSNKNRRASPLLSADEQTSSLPQENA